MDRFLPRAWTALLLVAGLATACTGTQDSAEPTPTAAATATPDGPTPTPIPIGVEIESFEFTPGRCFNHYERIDETTGEVQPFTTELECDAAHHGEVYAQFDHPAGPGDPFPGTVALETWARAECYLRFEAFVGIAYELSELEIGSFRPTDENWLNPYRTVHCWVTLPDRDLSTSVQGTSM